MTQGEIGGFVKTLEEFEAHLGRHGWVTSREEQRASTKLLVKQTVMARQGEFYARAIYTRRAIAEGADQIDFNYSGAHLAPGEDVIRWCTFRNQAELMRFAHEYDTGLLVPSGPPPATGRKGTRCRCKKVRFKERGQAEAVLRKIKRERMRFGDRKAKRQEERVYECPSDKTLYHLTSQKEWVEEPDGRPEETVSLVKGSTGTEGEEAWQN